MRLAALGMPTSPSSSMDRLTASEWLMPRCSSRPSVISRSMLSTGFRLVTGSWKIIAMSRPRMARTLSSGIVRRS